MDTRSKVVAAVLFLAIIAGMFVFAYLKRAELTQEQETQVPTEPQEPVEGPYDQIERIDAKHFYIDGTHTLVGEIPFPTPCDLLNWDVSVAESFPEQVYIDFSVINNSEVCAQTVTNQRFSVSFGASEEARIQAELNGRELELNLIPPEEGETPEDFEIYIKG